MNMAENIKQIQSKTIVLLKVGAFCESCGKDSYILSYEYVKKIRKIIESTHFLL